MRGTERRTGALRRLAQDWAEALEGVDWDGLAPTETIDGNLFGDRLAADLAASEREAKRRAGTDGALPFASTLEGLLESRWSLATPDPESCASLLANAAQEAGALKKKLGEKSKRSKAPTAVEAVRIAERAAHLESELGRWFGHYEAYKPDFAWWCRKPVEELSEALKAVAKELREEVAGQKGEPDDPLVGVPVGREALLQDLRQARLPHTPEDLLAIAEREAAWCANEYRRVAKDLGFGKDWRKALEAAKADRMEVGSHEHVSRALAEEAIDFLERHDLVTVDPVCRETFRFDMLTAEQQKTLPYAAYGGQCMLVGAPVGEASHEDKLMSLRSNNVPFYRCFTPHELIPGHHLQLFMARRYGAWRELFHSPFFVEGWALHWEMRFWDLGWAERPLDQVGMLFWRMHRCARIVVSLRFHLGEMDPAGMAAHLEEHVGHEPLAARSEVRRYIGESYPPLYQCAYMIGGLQVHALWAELQPSWGDRRFHDALLRVGSIPIEAARALLRGDAWKRQAEPSWTLSVPTKKRS